MEITNLKHINRCKSNIENTAMMMANLDQVELVINRRKEIAININLYEFYITNGNDINFLTPFGSKMLFH